MSARDLSLRHLLALQAVDDTGSYRRAAERLGYSQAAITGQVAALEKALGAPVFVRHGGARGVSLTDAGREALRAAGDLVARADLLDARLAALVEGRAGRLAVGTFQSVSSTLLPPVLAAARAEDPEAEVSVLESDDNEVLAGWVASGRVDATFLVGPFGDARLSITEACRDPYVAVMRREDAPRGALALGALADLPLIGHHHCVCHEQLDRGLREAGVRASYVFRSNDNAAVQAMVRAGLGVAVMPALSVAAEDPEVRLVPLSPAVPARAILVAVPAHGATPRAEAFVRRVVAEGERFTSSFPRDSSR